MATNNRGPAGRGRRNNNPEGRNQYSGVMSTARDNPLATAAAVGGVVAAGVFLWSRRSQISDRIGNVADQLSERREGTSTKSGNSPADTNSGENVVAESPSRNGERTQVEIAEEALTLKEAGAGA
jgi:hypothetical protein